MQYHVADKLSSDVGRDERIKRMGSAECVPQAKSAMICLPFGHLLDFEVGGHVATIHVAHRVGLHQHVIETRIEDGLLLVGTFNVDTAQFVLPSVVGGLHIVVEMPALGFGLHVFSGTFIIYRRDGYFDH